MRIDASGLPVRRSQCLQQCLLDLIPSQVSRSGVPGLGYPEYNGGHHKSHQSDQRLQRLQMRERPGGKLRKADIGKTIRQIVEDPDAHRIEIMQMMPDGMKAVEITKTKAK